MGWIRAIWKWYWLPYWIWAFFINIYANSLIQHSHCIDHSNICIYSMHMYASKKSIIFKSSFSRNNWKYYWWHYLNIVVIYFSI